MLNVRGLSKKFGDITAVNEVSFNVASGEIFCLIGPNGAGKTTIIKSIVGLLQSDHGTILVQDKDIAKDPRGAKSLIGYIPDDPSAWPAMTGEEFMHFVGTLFGMPLSERLSEMKRWLSVFDLEGVEGNYFESYSRGNKQKFSILAALLHKPKVLLIDEPIVGLDPVSARKAKELFVEFAKSGGSVLLATHTLTVAEEIGTMIGVMKQGKLVAEGTMDELRQMAHAPEAATLEDLYMTLTESKT